MRKAVMKGKGALGRWELERLKPAHSGFQVLNECVFPLLNEVRQSRIPLDSHQPLNIGKC